MRTHEQVEDGVGEAGDQQAGDRDGRIVPTAQRGAGKQGCDQREQEAVRDAWICGIAEGPYREVVHVGADREGDVHDRNLPARTRGMVAAEENGESGRGVTEEGRHGRLVEVREVDNFGGSACGGDAVQVRSG